MTKCYCGRPPIYGVSKCVEHATEQELRRAVRLRAELDERAQDPPVDSEHPAGSHSDYCRCHWCV